MASPIKLLTHATGGPLSPVRVAIRHWVLSAFPRTEGSGIDYDHPLGDTGLFGPDSATWRVHSDFPGMLSGGLAALTLQTLHPLALAGVWDHSNFRNDLIWPASAHHDVRGCNDVCLPDRQFSAGLPPLQPRRVADGSR